MSKWVTKRLRIEGTTLAMDIKVQEWTRNAAVKKGLKISGMILLGALASILIPLIHFLSVPIGVISAPIIGVVIYKAYVGQFEVMAGNIECQFCHQIFSIEKITFLDVIQVECKECKNMTTLILE